MQSLISDNYFKFRTNALQEVRKTYELDGQGAMSDAVDILEKWVQEQKHFVKKDFDRDYLERSIIRAKGSIERSKQRLDKLCTSRTLIPSFFVNCNVKDIKQLDDLEDVILPRATADHSRIYILRNRGQEFGSDFFMNYNRRIIYAAEYLCANDYGNGAEIIFDYRETNIMAMMKRLDLVQFQQIMNLAMECYGLRVKGIHMISTSKVVDAVISLFKSVLSSKIGNRIHAHKTLESLHKYVDKDILPVEYGGTEKPMTEVFNQFMDLLSSEDNQKYMKMMNEAYTNEANRQTDKFNEQCLGLPGTFRTLRVD